MNISSKLGLYDFLCFFVIGVLLLAILCPVSMVEKGLCNCVRCSDSTLSNVVVSFIFGVFAYLLGLIWHHITEFLITAISFCVRKHISEQKFCCKAKHLISSMRRNNIEMIKDQYEIESRRGCLKRKVVLYSNDCFNRRYLFAYYYLQKNGQLGNIPILESQEAFLRDLFIPLCILPISTFCRCANVWNHIVDTYFSDYTNNVGIFLLILVLLDLIVHCKIQKKIFQLVIEGTHYLSSLESLQHSFVDPCSCKTNNLIDC